MSGSQNVRVEEQYHYAVPPPQPFGQPVTYYQVPAQPITIPQPQIKPQIQPPQVYQAPVDQGKVTTTSTYTYAQYPAQSAYVSNLSGGQYTTQTTTQYSRPPPGAYQVPEGGDRPKSNMELTLEKIDEQLQMSRKMFPSWYFYFVSYNNT